MRQAGFAHGRLKAAAQRCERKIRVLHPLGSGLLQYLRQSAKGILLFQKADGLQRLRIGAGRFAEVCGVAVGLSVGLVAHLFEGFLCMHFLCSVSSAHKAEQPFHIGPGLDVDQVHAVAAGAVWCKLMLCQQRFKVPCQIGAGGKKFQIIFFLRINNRSTAQKAAPMYALTQV